MSKKILFYFIFNFMRRLKPAATNKELGKVKALSSPLLFLFFSLLSALYSLLSCSDTEILSGAWKSTEKMKNSEIQSLYEKNIKMVIGHFGPEVAGVLTYYTDDNFTQIAEDYNCQCTYMNKGEYSNRTFTFSFESLGDCKNISGNCEYKKDVQNIESDLNAGSGEYMLLCTFTKKENDTILKATSTFVRDVEMVDIKANDKKCEKE